MAKDLGWLHSDSVTDSVMTSFAAAKYWRAVQQYDGSWLVPGAIFVMADPMTTISDPDPKTCGTFCRNDTEDHLSEMEETSPDDLQRPSWCESVPSPEPTARRTSFTADVSAGCGQRIPEMEEISPDDMQKPSVCGPLPGSLDAQVSGRKRPTVPELDEASLDCASPVIPGCSVKSLVSIRSLDSAGGVQPAWTGTPASCASVYTVCKDYEPRVTPSTDFESDGEGWPEAKPFVDFLLAEGIRDVVRVNLPNESGLVEIGGSYDPMLLTRAGLWHADVPVSDRVDGRGAVPDARTVRRFLRLVGERLLEGGGAVLVHCKGGFGRSVFLACLLVVYRYDVPGRGLLGWARIARPGAITTPEQEDALRSLAGRADLCRRWGVAPPGRQGWVQGPPACCAVS